ncbi:Uncharacterized conserved protein, DUF885 familyt [Streptosporangium subroseum]|uniref:Uncharacterized conserved protein, DUF885 familyt n=1 Tax=Streptosporangium subroseum TaxID=106412 RepID=A0A239DIK4_9ACTN|nr:DUF885 domain-containing protein [Streptosporangium subroseum]SNS32217.1 Uncharacterized conserved protein, DUF885 familyt [Streptosporangium subroseum]
MSTPIFALCDEYVTRWAALDPIAAGAEGIVSDFVAASDHSPAGSAARAELIRTTLSRLDAIVPTGESDVRAATHLRERLEAELAWHDTGEPLRWVAAPYGLPYRVRSSVVLLPHGNDDEWRDVAARLAAIPTMLAGWRESLEAGLAVGLRGARRQALAMADQSDQFAGAGDTPPAHDAFVATYGEGPVKEELVRSAAAAHAAYADAARYLREEYAPRATEVDAVGPERYAVAARISLGADIDLREAYEWGWAELERIGAETAAEVERIRPGATIEEATEILNDTQSVDSVEEYQAWLQQRHDWAIKQLHGTHFDIPLPLQLILAEVDVSSTSGAASYNAPSEDLSRPGRTLWPVGGRTRFATWSELTTIFHEAVPGHHLQFGAMRMAGDGLSRFAKVSWVDGHGEGWGLYAERLADELGWFTDPGTRLGMLNWSALRAARVVIDLGVHLDLPLPDGSKWTFEKACEVLRDQGRCEPHRVEAEVVRYFGWPAQAIAYKLGERAWLEAREEARRRLGAGFDLRAWHTAALELGPVGLSSLAEALRRIA